MSETHIWTNAHDDPETIREQWPVARWAKEFDRGRWAGAHDALTVVRSLNGDGHHEPSDPALSAAIEAIERMIRTRHGTEAVVTVDGEASRLREALDEAARDAHAVTARHVPGADCRADFETCPSPFCARYRDALAADRLTGADDWYRCEDDDCVKSHWHLDYTPLTSAETGAGPDAGRRNQSRS